MCKGPAAIVTKDGEKVFELCLSSPFTTKLRILYKFLISLIKIVEKPHLTYSIHTIRSCVKYLVYSIYCVFSTAYTEL